MFVIEVVLFARSAPTGSLSYRTRIRFSIGSLVLVPLRRQTVTGVVVACTPVRDVKAALKAASFTLRAGSPRLSGEIPAAYLDAAVTTAKYHALSLGSVFRVLIPETLLSHEFPKRFSNGSGAAVTFVEAPYVNRLQTYRQNIVKAHGHGSVLIIAPTAVEAARLARDLGEVVVITSELSAKRRDAALTLAHKAEVAVVTPHYAFTPIERLTHIIIERESANSYLNFQIPKLDWRIAVHALANTRKVPLTYGDYPLRLEIRPVPEKALHKTLHERIELVDTRTKNKPAVPRRTFAAVPKPLIRALSHVVSNGGRAVALAVRKGYAPAVVCRDCGTTVRDAHGRALALATINGKRTLRSADGSAIRNARTLCGECGGWNLIPLGIGVERVAEEIAQALPDALVVRFDADTVKTPAAARRAAKTFIEPRTIIVGTEALLHWLDPALPFSLSVVVSADTLLALPFWRARERFMRLALSLAERSERLIVATRHPDDVACTALTTVGAASFFKEETSLRAFFHYPPFGHILTIRIQSEARRLDTDEAFIREILAPYKPIRLPDRNSTTGRLAYTVRTLIIKIARDAWTSSVLAARLAALPPNISISVDSESLW